MLKPMCSTRHAHATSHRLADASRRLKENYQGRISSNRTTNVLKNPSIVTNSPTTVESSQSKFRKNKFSNQRAHIPNLKSSTALLRYLQDCVESGQADTSVFNVAVQLCGDKRWWDALLEIRAMQHHTGIPCNHILQSSLLTALSKCSKGQKFGVAKGRSQQILRTAKLVWNEATPNVVVLTSALTVCACVERDAALEWAE